MTAHRFIPSSLVTQQRLDWLRRWKKKKKRQKEKQKDGKLAEHRRGFDWTLGAWVRFIAAIAEDGAEWFPYTRERERKHPQPGCVETLGGTFRRWDEMCCEHTFVVAGPFGAGFFFFFFCRWQSAKTPRSRSTSLPSEKTLQWTWWQNVLSAQSSHASTDWRGKKILSCGRGTKTCLWVRGCFCLRMIWLKKISK